MIEKGCDVVCVVVEMVNLMMVFDQFGDDEDEEEDEDDEEECV